MCLIVLNWRPGHEWPLLLVANRDEFRERPTEPMHWWTQADSGAERPILAGRDLKAGGTWLALDDAGRLALLTNIRPGYLGKASSRSRGELPLRFLRDHADIPAFHRAVRSEIDQYGGFNLLLGDGERLFWFSSDHPDGRWLEPGIHSISNDALDTPWPKTEKACRQMARQTPVLERDFHSATLLSDRSVAPDAALPATGLPLDRERQLSAQTITGEVYGTRCRTWIRAHRDGKMDVAEVQLNEQGEPGQQEAFELSTPARHRGL